MPEKELHDVKEEHIDEMVLQTKHLRKCANEKMKDASLAEKLHSVVSAWERVTTLMIKRQSSKQIKKEEQTPEPTPPTNGTDKQSLSKMSQSAAVLRP